jgi:demethylmenaquinone methyltransferase/2-methoxy-6-polyprenyl-1,4-benzoquinol methylase
MVEVMIDGRLEAVRDVYAVWGRHPLLYAAQDWITFVGRPRAIRLRAVEALALRPGTRVLEVACGTGRNFDYLERAIGPNGSLVGFDFSREMLEAARDLVARRGWRNVELVQGDAAVLDVGSAPFDGVLCVLGMSAIPDHRRALERCRAVLRPGGVVVVCDGRAFTGTLAVANPLLRAVYGRWAAWSSERDVVGDMRHVFGDVVLDELTARTLFIAKATH